MTQGLNYKPSRDPKTQRRTYRPEEEDPFFEKLTLDEEIYGVKLSPTRTKEEGKREERGGGKTFFKGFIETLTLIYFEFPMSSLNPWYKLRVLIMQET